MDKNEIYLILSNVLEALLYYLKNKISHQDIKPSNILSFESRKYWKLSDVGMETVNTKTMYEVNSN